MINNSYAILEGLQPRTDRLTFFENKGKDGKEKSVFVPDRKIAEEGAYYWLGDGFVNREQQNRLYIFGYRVRNTGAAVFGFEEIGNSLLIARPESTSAQALSESFRDVQEIPTPLFLRDSVDGTSGSFGAGILVNTASAGAPDADGYVYIYGVKGKQKELMVARVKAENFDQFGHTELVRNPIGERGRSVDLRIPGIAIPITPGCQLVRFFQRPQKRTYAVPAAVYPASVDGCLALSPCS